MTCNIFHSSESASSVTYVEEFHTPHPLSKAKNYHFTFPDSERIPYGHNLFHKYRLIFSVTLTDIWNIVVLLVARNTFCLGDHALRRVFPRYDDWYRIYLPSCVMWVCKMMTAVLIYLIELRWYEQIYIWRVTGIKSLLLIP